MFCSKCGAKLPLRPDPTPAPEPPPPEAPSDPAPAVLPEPALPQPAVVEVPPVQAVGQPEPEAPAAIGPSARRVPGAARTMLGMPMPDSDAIAVARVAAAQKRAAKEKGPEPEEEPSSPRLPGGSGGRTMLGMPSPQAAQVQAAVEAAKARIAEKEAAHAASPSDASAAATELDLAPPGQEAPPKRSPAAMLDPNTNRTMLGQPAPRVDVPPEDDPEPDPSRGDSHRRARGRFAVIYPSTTGEEDALVVTPKKPAGRGLAMGVLALGVLVLVIGGGALAWTLLGHGSGLHATVVQGDEGEMLEIEVPGAEPGTRVRFHGSEQPLEAGTVRFPLSPEDLTLGDNELGVDVVAPGGAVETHTVALHLELRVRADLGALQSAPPAIEVVVEAPVGSEVALDGEPLALDERGRGTRRFPIDHAGANAEGVVEHVVRYRVDPPDGETEQGELHTRIPITTMQIDRPGTQVVTDHDSIEIAGAVAPGSTVTVDGNAVEVRMGRFLASYPLPTPREHTVEVVARAPGKAPHLERISIRRVADLAAEAAAFEVNPELTYARISQNASTYRGQHVAFEGLVYNLDVRDGRSVLQILVTDCPTGERCPLWVTYAAATEAELRSQVRVLGTVAGEQQFRSQSGAIRTVPRVDATFVLPVTSARPNNQRR
jgi:hypothetical protein